MTSKTTTIETKYPDGWIHQTIIFEPEVDTFPFINFKFSKK